MPEGPEVTIVTKQLNKAVQNKTIKDIEIVSGRYLKKEPSGFTDYVNWAVNDFPQTVLEEISEHLNFFIVKGLQQH